ncbi:cold-shock protein [Polycladidibacter stylochi]|uniref:cold-shock protein n=1 Tax=Polycladidibacter stylochi TaxID=1807766 RepID=UPI0009E7DBDB|nr:cold-shock protein [Pseudovibrio stylochi]
MHNGNSGRRTRNKRGGKREFGAEQEFGTEFAPPEFLQESPRDYSRDSWGNANNSQYNTPDNSRSSNNNMADRGFGAGGYNANSQRGANRSQPYAQQPSPAYQASGYGNNNERGGFGGDHGNNHGGGNSGGPRRSYPPVERGPRQYGIVKFFKLDKGFGFITPDEGPNDVFVHISAVERSGLNNLFSGQRISFETEPDRRGKGPKAVELRLEEASQAPAQGASQQQQTPQNAPQANNHHSSEQPEVVWDQPMPDEVD